MTAPRVSVLMPVRDGARYLAPAVESILRQSHGDFEFLVVDDGSADATGEILARFAEVDGRVRVLRRDATGTTPALNLVIAEARGAYLARMDADDVARPERFARQVAALDADPGLGAVGSFVEYIDAEDRPIRIFEAPVTHEAIDRAHLDEGVPRLWHPAAMLRAEVVRRIGGYDEGYRYGQDYDLWLRLAEVARLANLPEVLLGYRVHLGSVSATKRDVQNELAWRALDAALARRGISGGRRRAFPLPESETAIMRKWAWWALGAGNLGTARHYALQSLRRAPLSRDSLALGASVLRASLGARRT